MALRPRHAIRIVALALAASAGAGCAKDSTGVVVTVATDATVPPLLILRGTVATADVPPRTSTAELSSPYASDAGDRPGPFMFPLLLPLTVDSSLAGLVAITVEGLDWDTHAVIARGTTSGGVVREQTTAASLTMTGVVTSGGGDGSTD